MDHNPFLKVLTLELTSGSWEMKIKVRSVQKVEKED